MNLFRFYTCFFVGIDLFLDGVKATEEVVVKHWEHDVCVVYLIARLVQGWKTYHTEARLYFVKSLQIWIKSAERAPTWLAQKNGLVFVVEDEATSTF